MNKHTLADLASRIGQDLLRIKFPLLLTVIYFTAAFLFAGEICPLRILTGFPCPGCGLTRAGFFVLTGQWGCAAQMNPTVFLWIPALAALFFTRYLFPEAKRYAYAFLIVTAVFTLICYTVRMALLFPEPPLTYYRENLLSVFMNSIL